jgi:hypothetical protein
MRKFIIAAYWNRRKNNLNDLVDSTMELLLLIKKLFPQLDNWKEKTVTKRKMENNSKTVFDKNDILHSFKQNIRDSDGQPIPELGFSIGLWSKTIDGNTASLNITAGIYTDTKSIKNSCVLKIPLVNELEIASLGSLLEKISLSFEPVWGVIADEERFYSKSFDDNNPCRGSFIYLNEEYTYDQIDNVEIRQLGKGVLLRENENGFTEKMLIRKNFKIK